MYYSTYNRKHITIAVRFQASRQKIWIINFHLKEFRGLASDFYSSLDSPLSMLKYTNLRFLLPGKVVQNHVFFVAQLENLAAAHIFYSF